MNDARPVPPHAFALRRLVVAAIAGAVLAAPCAAQTASDAAAYTALLLTPLGAFAPWPTSTMLGTPLNGAQLGLRYGHTPDVSDNFAATAILPAGTVSTLSLTAGLLHPSTCGNSCDNLLVLSVGGDTRLTSWRVGEGKDPDMLTMSLNGELGFGRTTGERYLAGTVGVPFALTIGGGGGGMRIAPYVTPAFGFGNAHVDDNFGFGTSDESGSRVMIGGGIGLWNPTSSVSVSGGFQHVVFDNAKTVWGITVTLGGGK